MNYHNPHQRSHIVALIILLFVVATMTYFSDMMARRMAAEEKSKMLLWAEAYRIIGSENASDDAAGIALKIISANKTIPMIVLDFNGHLSALNIKPPKDNVDEFLQKKLEEFKNDEANEPLKVSVNADGETFTNYIYYGRSNLLKRLSLFPIWQVSIIALFLILAYYFFNVSKRSEENRVWVGLSKETAHQLGTPISSLLAWVDLMRNGIKTDNIADEMQKDITRLQTVSNRFSKIGSKPTLEMQNIIEVLNDSITYLSSRIPPRIKIVKNFDRDQFIPVLINAELFEWVIENLIKNAVDAMRGGGNISIALKEEEKNVFIDFNDQGKGLPRKKYKAIFNPGYSSKKRGWGLGLSFAKRIIKDYHGGKIFVKKSEINVGTTFRMVLPKALSPEESKEK